MERRRMIGAVAAARANAYLLGWGGRGFERAEEDAWEEASEHWNEALRAVKAGDLIAALEHLDGAASIARYWGGDDRFERQAARAIENGVAYSQYRRAAGREEFGEWVDPHMIRSPAQSGWSAYRARLEREQARAARLSPPAHLGPAALLASANSREDESGDGVDDSGADDGDDDSGVDDGDDDVLGFPR